MIGDTPEDGENVVAPPTVCEMQDHLERVLGSPTFLRSPRMQRLLRYLVAETFAGRGAQLKEYSLAVSVFDKPEDFDPGTSAAIRVEAGRLRRLLAQYGNEHGQSDRIRLSVPKGGYVPAFEWITTNDALAAPSHEPADPRGVGPPDLHLLPGGEWRWLTVMSCAFDLPAGAYSGVDDEYLATYGRLRSFVTSVMQHHGGTVDVGASDQLTVYFGWPDAMEDAAGRAMTAALDAVTSLSGNANGGGIRIGIATSRVVSRVIDDRLLFIGQAVPLVAKMLDRVPVGGILVSENSRRLSRTVFETIPAGSIEIGGGQRTVLWRLLSFSATARSWARRGKTMTSMVGRREEMELLASRWRLAIAGEGQVVLIEGEAGIGKSRLSEAVLGNLSPAGSKIRILCSPHHTNSALYPVIEFLRALLGTEGDQLETKNHLSRFLRRFGLDSSVNRALLMHLLSQMEEGETPFASTSQQKEQMLLLVVRILTEQCRKRPTVVLIEDIHWADPTTLELITEISARSGTLNLYVLMTGRLGCFALFTAPNMITALRLSRLPRSDCNLMIDHLARNAMLLDQVRSTIIEKADGIPLFVEELTKLFLTNDVNHTLPSSVPESLNNLLASQLSHLGFARRIAQVSTAIGRDFSTEMLKAVTGEESERVDAAVDQLLAAGIFTRSRSEMSERYQFRHALLRDAAYASIVETDRKDLHYRVGTVLVDSFPEVAVDHPEIIAEHMRDAGRFDDAIPFWVDAGRKAARRYELVESIKNFQNALEALTSLPTSKGSSERELEILLELGLTVRNAYGYYAPDLHIIYERARILSSELGKTMAMASSIYGLWTHAAGSGQWSLANQFAREFEEFARTHADNGQMQVEASRLLGACAAFRGDFAHARIYFERAEELYDFDRHGPGFGYDPGAASAAYLSWILWHIGEPEEARKAADRALAIAEGKEHPATLAMVLAWLLFHALCERDVQRIHVYNERLQAICSERACRYWQPFGNACVEWMAFQADGHAFHLKRLNGFINDFSELYLTSSLHIMALEICLELELFEEGMRTSELARDFIELHGERIWEAEYLRLTGQLLLLQPERRAEAEEYLEGALRVARAQAARPLERRAVAALEEASKMPRRISAVVSRSSEKD